jgi:hypothetical protein
MTDIVDRLRRPAPKFGFEEFDPTFDCRQEGAAEIERLRAALMELLWCAEELQETDSHGFLSAITKAKEALNQQITNHTGE